MKRLSSATKRFGQLTSNYNFFADSWFSSVKNTEEAMYAGFDYCGPEKTRHKGFGLVTL